MNIEQTRFLQSGITKLVKAGCRDKNEAKILTYLEKVDERLKCVDNNGNSYEIGYTGLETINKVNFITPSYEILFAVWDLDKVSFRGEETIVVYIDSHHFKFKNSAAWHICQFAEAVNYSGKEVIHINR